MPVIFPRGAPDMVLDACASVCAGGRDALSVDDAAESLSLSMVRGANRAGRSP